MLLSVGFTIRASGPQILCSALRDSDILRGHCGRSRPAPNPLLYRLGVGEGVETHAKDVFFVKFAAYMWQFETSLCLTRSNGVL